MLGKILGGGLGWILGGGPIGALIGVAIGSAFDKGGTSIFKSDEDPKQHGRKRQTQRGDFSAALIVVSAAVMTADGKILKSELDYVKRYFLQNFGEAIAIEKIKVLGEVLKQEIPIDDVANQIKLNMRIAEKRLLVQYMFGIALSDGEIHRTEIDMIQRISNGIGINHYEFLSMKAMYTQQHSHGGQRSYQSGRQQARKQQGPSLNTCYQILGIASSSTEVELKKAYRKLAVKYHPDKVAHLGQDHVQTAEDKFQKVQEAYEKIKDSRGLN
jgi:DnaJ like chaperone protein